jgi:sugar lactone lactonase YvrE
MHSPSILLLAGLSYRFVTLLILALLMGTGLRAQITWSHFAGAPGGPGFEDGFASEARFNRPCSVATDMAGNAFVADLFNHTIRKITPAGVVSTIAGSPGVAGATDGAGMDARFYNPIDVAVDASDNLFVADRGNNSIRKITPDGIVSTLAGGTYGYLNGTGATARFQSPESIAVAPDGSLVVTEYTPAIRRVSTSGTVTTIAGGITAGTADGVGSLARFGTSVSGVVVDSLGNIFVADSANYTIRKIDPSATVTTIAGRAGVQSALDGPIVTATLHYPTGLTIDSNGNLFFAEYLLGTVRKISPTDGVSTIAGIAGVVGYTDGPPDTATFYLPTDLAVDPAGNILVADLRNHSIRKILPSGLVTTMAGLANYGSADGTGYAAKFKSPDGIAVDRQGNVFVSDRENNTIRRITPTGDVRTLAGQAGMPGSTDGPGADARFNYPRGLAVDAQGYVYVSEVINHTIRKITPAGNVSTLAGFAGSSGNTDGMGTAARFNGPADVVVNSDGILYVADWRNDLIRRVTPEGMVTAYAGNSVGASPSPFIPSSICRSPIGLAINPRGVLFTIEYSNFDILRILPDNTLSSLAGSTSWVPGTTDGLGPAARFYQSVGIAADSQGNSYVADTTNNTIRKITANGWVSTIGGTPALIGQGIGIGAAAHFYNPTAIAVGPDGAIYVANKFGNNIVKGIVTGPEIWVSSALPLASPATIESYGKRDFGTVSLGSQSSVAFAIGNSGLSQLAGIGVSITGIDAADFGVVTAPTESINPADSSTLVLRFSPLTTGSKSAVLHISSNDIDEADYTITLSAYGVAAIPEGALCWTNHVGGMGVSGCENGDLTDARFSTPVSIAFGRTGNLYVADSGNHAIRKISNSGIVTTLAGQVSVSGSADGMGAFARFKGPKAVAVDADENVYVADTGNHTIRKISPNGTVTTLAGQPGVQGSLDGQAGLARFNSPSGISFDPVEDRLIVADTSNHILRALSTQGYVSTLAGSPMVSGAIDGPASSARFYNPSGIAVDVSGTIFVCDSSNHTIRIIHTTGDVSTLAGKAATPGNMDGQGTAARLNFPSAITVDAGGMACFTDRSSHTVRQISPAGWVSTSGGTPSQSGAMAGVGAAARFTTPDGIAISPEGRIFVSNTAKHHIFRSTSIGPDIAVLTAVYATVPNFSTETLDAPRQGLATMDFVVRNVGSACLTGLTAAVLGLDAADFGITGSVPSSLDPDATVDLQVRLSPPDLGPKHGQIHIESNDPDETPFEIFLQGTSLKLRDYWRKSYFATTVNTGNAADSADPDGDGIVNLIEYAFGMDPWNPTRLDTTTAAGGLPSSSAWLDVNGSRLRIEYVRRKASSLPDISYDAEFCSSLDGGGQGWDSGIFSEVVFPVDSSSWERVIVEDSQEGQPRRFGRIRVTPAGY